VSVRPTLDLILTRPDCVDGLPREVITELLAQSAAVQSTLTASLLRPTPAPVPAGDADDMMLTTPEAARLLRKSPRWIYRRAGTLPFVRRLSPRSMVHSKRGIERYLATRKP
jgi:predicted DNA-binding transcriptional regulator AlpA